jgi:hypothetical protein
MLPVETLLKAHELIASGTKSAALPGILHLPVSQARALHHAIVYKGRSGQYVDETAVKNLWLEGLTTAEIAKQVGCSLGAVQGIRRRLNLPKRKPGRRPANG